MIKRYISICALSFLALGANAFANEEVNENTLVTHEKLFSEDEQALADNEEANDTQEIFANEEGESSEEKFACEGEEEGECGCGCIRQERLASGDDKEEGNLLADNEEANDEEGQLLADSEESSGKDDSGSKELLADNEEANDEEGQLLADSEESSSEDKLFAACNCPVEMIEKLKAEKAQSNEDEKLA